jgi:UDP-N-acetylmuramate dehydrogenase
MDEWIANLIGACGAERVRRGIALAPHTTFGIGGPADAVLDASSAEQVGAAIAITRRAGIPVTVLGGGSNVLVADRGIRGLVVRVRVMHVAVEDACTIRADAGLTINGLVRWMASRGLGGFEAWAGTPGTLGGAVAGNAHFGGRLISEGVVSVALLQSDGSVVDVPATHMAFGYDRSRVQTSGEIVIGARLRVTPSCDPVALRGVARESLAFRKRTQPLHLRSAGCAFQNPTPEQDRLPDGMPWSAGALIDRAGLKGRRIGGAAVSAVHANFIVNEGGATASDVRSLVEWCRHAVADQFGVMLRDEIVYLGEW